MAKSKGERRSTFTLAAFAGPGLPFAGLGLPLAVHLSPFYAESVGLSLSVVGAIFMAVKLADIPFDPILGGWMDRTRTKIGRFKPWMLACVPVLLAATWLMFMPLGPASPALDLFNGLAQGFGREAYLTVALILVYIGFSMAALAQTSWAATLSADYDQRSRIYGAWQMGNVVGMLLILALPVVITNLFKGTHEQGVEAMGWFIIITLPITVGLAVWKVPEPPPTTECHAKLSDYIAFFKLTAVRRLMITDLLYGLAPGVTGALALFYFKAAKGMSDGQANILIFLYFAAGLAGAPLWAWAATKLGKHKALAVAGLCYAAAYVGVWLAPHGNFPLQALAMLCVGLPFSATPILLRSMMADVGDEERLKSGEDRTGMLYALLTATNKVGYAVAVATYWPLDMAGFDKTPGASNTPEAIGALTLLFVGLPIVLLLAGALIIRGFPIDEARQKANRAALEAQGQAG